MAETPTERKRLRIERIDVEELELERGLAALERIADGLEKIVELIETVSDSDRQVLRTFETGGDH